MSTLTEPKTALELQIEQAEEALRASDTEHWREKIAVLTSLKEAEDDRLLARKRQVLVTLDASGKAAQEAQECFVAALDGLLTSGEHARRTMLAYQAALSEARKLGIVSGRPPEVERLGTRARHDRDLDKQLVAVRNVVIGL